MVYAKSKSWLYILLLLMTIKEDFHFATMSVCHFYKILKDHVFGYFCYPISYLSIWGFFTIILSCQMWLYFKVVVVGYKKVESTAKASILGCHWNGCVWWVSCCFWCYICYGLGWWRLFICGTRTEMLHGKSLEVFGVTVIVDIIKLLQPLESHNITTLFSTSKPLPRQQFYIILIIKLIISSLNQQLNIFINQLYFVVAVKYFIFMH